jgi:TonB family protein
MPRSTVFGLHVALPGVLGYGYQGGVAALFPHAREAGVKLDRYGIYTVGGQVAAPALRYSEPAVYTDRMCEMDVTGTVMVTAIVGTDGEPIGTDVLIPLARPHNLAAVNATNQMRFDPASINGTPVPVRIFVEFTFPPGGGVALPVIVQGEKAIEAPVPLNSVWAIYPRSARRRRVMGNVIISFVVTEHGRPADIHLIRPVAPELDESAMRAVRRLRFKPALMDGKIVPTHLTINFTFRIFY